jgi:hypothetical protein
MGGWARLVNLLFMGHAIGACVAVVAAAVGDPVTLLLLGGMTLALGLVGGASLVACALTPRLPWGLVAMLSLSALWLVTGAAPLAIVVEDEAARPWAAALVRIAIALVGYAWIRALGGGREGMLPLTRATGPAFSPAHTLAALAAGMLVLVPGAFLYSGVWLATSIQVWTQGFVGFDRKGVTLGDRRYERDATEIRLVGMMHVGEESAYRALVGTFNGPSTVILAEGVTDEQGVLEIPLAYGRAAGALGLQSQQEIGAYLVDDDREAIGSEAAVRRADVDASSFEPGTIELLGWVARIWTSDDPIEAFEQYVERFSSQPEVVRAAQRDIFERRNAHLLAMIDEAIPEFERIVVPWGALHLPDIEREILLDGFEPTTRSRHRLLSWATILTALATLDAPPDGESPAPPAG